MNVEKLKFKTEQGHLDAELRKAQNNILCEVSISHWGIFLIDYKYRGLCYFRYS